jgi:hypothetical protein
MTGRLIKQGWMFTGQQGPLHCKIFGDKKRQSRGKNEQISRLDLRLVVENDIQQSTVDCDAAVVVDEAQLSKFVHEEQAIEVFGQ